MSSCHWKPFLAQCLYNCRCNLELSIFLSSIIMTTHNFHITWRRHIIMHYPLIRAHYHSHNVKNYCLFQGFEMMNIAYVIPLTVTYTCFLMFWTSFWYFSFSSSFTRAISVIFKYSSYMYNKHMSVQTHAQHVKPTFNQWFYQGKT